MDILALSTTPPHVALLELPAAQVSAAFILVSVFDGDPALSLILVEGAACLSLSWVSGDGVAIAATVAPSGDTALGVSVAGQTRTTSINRDSLEEWADMARAVFAAPDDASARVVALAYLMSAGDPVAHSLLSSAPPNQRD